MSQNTIKEEDLKRLRQALEKELGWGAASEWHSSIFKELSERIFDKCHIVLSPVTLKRFWGVVKYEGQPSISTLDTLAQFIDHENWRTFKLDARKRKRPRLTIGKNLTKKTVYVSAGFFAALITVLLVSNKRINEPELLETVSFSSRPVTNAYPNSVVFDFDLKGVDADSLYIQQYWDETKTISIREDQQQATGIYYFPGYFRAKLVVDGEVARQHDLFLRSNGWIGTIEYEPVPKYFDPIIRPENGLVYPEELAEEIAASPKPLISVFHYINDLGNVSGDNFTLSASLKADWSEKWAVCNAAWIYIIGTGGAMIVPFSKTGCSSNNSLLLNDVYLDGKEHDLSAFGTDLSEFQDIQLVVRNQQMKVLIQGMEVYQATYKQSMGRFVGLRFKFLGLGRVDSLRLENQSGQEIQLR